MQIQAIKVQRLYLQVAQQLENLIASGTFTAGSRLPSERDLAGQFGVSRPTIREAMIALEITGRVEVRSGSGVYVNERESNHLALHEDQNLSALQILEARKLIEGEICALCAEKATDQQLDRLQDLTQKMVDETEDSFHFLMAEIADNSALTIAMVWLRQLSKGLGAPTDHAAIFETLRTREPEASRTAIKNSLQRAIDNLPGVQ